MTAIQGHTTPGRYTLRELLRNRKRNPRPGWMPPDDPKSAAHALLAGGFVRVHTLPKFTIPRTAKVVTIGSCFARNAEITLRRLGMNVPFFQLPDNFYAGQLRGSAVLNKYNTESIEQAILSDLDLVDYPNDGFIETPDGNWWDPLATGLRPLPLESLRLVRREIRDVTRNLLDCDAVLLTLGLNQVWRDRETGITINEKPPQAIVRAYPERWELVVTGVGENIGSLERVVTTIRDVNPKAQIVVTVSPVPMGTTLTTTDVIAANTYSKAVLRVAAQDVADRFDYVDYFPSYEIAVNSPPELTWQADRLHVTSEAVRFIVDCFLEDYVEGYEPGEQGAGA